MPHLMIKMFNQTLNLWKQTIMIDSIYFLCSFSTPIILHCDFLWWCRVRLRRLARCPANKPSCGYDDYYMGWGLSKQIPSVQIMKLNSFKNLTCLGELVFGHHGWATPTSRSKLGFHMGIQRSHWFFFSCQLAASFSFSGLWRRRVCIALFHDCMLKRDACYRQAIWFPPQRHGFNCFHGCSDSSISP